jgi:hypothetical protein
MIFAILAVFYFVGSVVFNFFSSTETQSWAKNEFKVGEEEEEGKKEEQNLSSKVEENA